MNKVRSFTLMSCVLLFCVAGCGGAGGDPKGAFEAMTNGLDDKLKPLIASSPDVAFNGTSYNIEKTDSLVSPYIGYIDVDSAMKAEQSSESQKFGLKFLFAFQDNRWVHTKTESYVGESPFAIEPGMEHIYEAKDKLNKAIQASKLLGKIDAFVDKHANDILKVIEQR